MVFPCQVLLEKMGLPDELDSGSSSVHGDTQRCCQAWNKIECRIATLEFDRDRKSMGVIVRYNAGRKSLLVKGAIENVLERSSFIQLADGSVAELDQNSKAKILHEMSTAALCVHNSLHMMVTRTIQHITFYLIQLTTLPEDNLTFVGLVGLRRYA